MKFENSPSPATESLAAAIYEALHAESDAVVVDRSIVGRHFDLEPRRHEAFLRVAAKIAEAHLAILAGAPDVPMERVIFEALEEDPAADPVILPRTWDMLHELDRERYQKVAGAASLAFLRATARGAMALPSPYETLAILALSILRTTERGKLLTEARDLLELAELAPADGDKADALVARIDEDLKDDAPIVPDFAKKVKA